MTVNILNTFIQTKINYKDGDDQIVMKINSHLVDLLTKLDPRAHKGCIVYEDGKQVLYLVVQRAIYGMLQSSLLYYKKFHGNLESQGFKFNLCDPCVANKKIDGEFHTALFHVDDLKASHKEKKVVDEFAEWLEVTCGLPVDL